MKYFFIADTHFGDENIISYEGRPFKNAYEMQEVLIQNWNSVVNEEDIVFVVGDYSNIDYYQTEKITKRLKGKKYLIKGNHDTFTNEQYLKMGFVNVYDYPILVADYFLLSHKPLYVNKNMPYVNIYGHVHNNPNYNTYSFCGHCVSVEKIDYKPISLELISKRILSIRNKFETKNDFNK